MPWQEVRPMDQKIRFISDYLNEYFTFTELCTRFGISRKTGYKWVSRYLVTGSLNDLSRKPHNSPAQTRSEVVESILKVRDRHPSWGPRKLLWRLEKDHPDWELPAYSTAALILNRHGYIKAKRKKIKRSHPGQPVTPITYPNEVWTADFKGHFKTRDGFYCYPLTIADGHSRYLFSCHGMLSPLQKDTKAVFKRLFKEHGLPKRIRTDNGNPFASNAIGRISRLSAWWIRLGILPELIEPGCPQQNGRHERMHRTLKYETTIPPAADLKRQQHRFDSFQGIYNHERPHEALEMKTPDEVYVKSDRPMPAKLPAVEYPGHYEIRKVSKNCGIRWNHRRVCVSQVLAGEYVGLEEIATGEWDLYYGPVWLGRFYEKTMQIMDQYGKFQRKKMT